MVLRSRLHSLGRLAFPPLLICMHNRIGCQSSVGCFSSTLRAAPPRWEGDGSGKVQRVTNSRECLVESHHEGVPVNALFSSPLQLGQYFEIDLLDFSKSALVGITSEKGFAEGWACRGLFFGGPGSLSDGAALSHARYGDALVPGMKIGVLTELVAGKLLVTFYQDGRCLGPAFLANQPGDVNLFPVVHATGGGNRFRINFPQEAPAGRVRETKSRSSMHPAEGTWRLKQVRTGTNLQAFPLESKLNGESATLTVDSLGPASNEFNLCFKIANSLMMRVKATTTTEPVQGIEQSGALISTRMMGPSGKMDLERELATHVGSLSEWVVLKDGTLVLTGDALQLRLVPEPDRSEGLPVSGINIP